jgi:hypothetical protein
VQVEITLIDPTAAPPAPPTQVIEDKPQAAPVMQPEISPKKDRKVKSYMNPIHNLKNKPGVAAPTPPAQPPARRPPSPVKNAASGRGPAKPEPAHAGRTQSKINKPQVPSSMKKQVPVQDIQQILDQNPSKR